ncbi:MAG: hypothetical protein QOJ29_2016 [Thermoleophilaceae bacterium]|jgi:hypothetical protein|nr:hypothetical protein [Thermoleophilaceae bacterium]
MNDGTAGFWSYVQADDTAEGGRILSLAAQLRAQFRLQTAEDLALFVDRESLEWGTEWQARIDAAIAGTTFFIPVVTPSYFRSAACRRELLKFAREAKRLGLEQLLMPVYWVTVNELESDPESSTDEAIRLVARYQWQDLREVRLEDEASSEFRKAVSGLAGELAERAAKVTSTVEDVPESPSPVAPEALQDARAGSGDDDVDDDEPGLLEKLATSEEVMPEITEIMDELTKRIELIGKLVETAGEQLGQADSRGQGMKAKLVLTERLARSLDEPTAEIEQLGQRYVAHLAQLDPGIHAWLDLADEAEPGEEGRADYLATITELAANADMALSELEGLVQSTREAARFSRSLRKPLQRMRTGLRGVLDGREVIEDWGRRAREIAERGEPPAGNGAGGTNGGSPRGAPDDAGGPSEYEPPKPEESEPGLEPPTEGTDDE